MSKEKVISLTDPDTKTVFFIPIDNVSYNEENHQLQFEYYTNLEEREKASFEPGYLDGKVRSLMEDFLADAIRNYSNQESD